MDATELIWMDGSFVPWHEAKVHVLAHSLHYGDGAFEGIRAYKTERGPAVFRLAEHVDRLFYSTKRRIWYVGARLCRCGVDQRVRTWGYRSGDGCRRRRPVACVDGRQS